MVISENVTKPKVVEGYPNWINEVFDFRKAIEPSELISLNFSYHFPRFEDVIQSIV